MNSAEFSHRIGCPQAGAEFLLEYQKSILISLKQQGLLNTAQLTSCFERLDTQMGKRNGISP